MRVIGEGTLHLYKPEDEVPREPTDEEFWQESWVIYFFDVKTKVYAFFRMSQEPNRNGGITTHWVHIWTPKQIYRNVQAVPMVDGDRTANGISSNGGLCRFEYDGKFNWYVSDPAAGLEMTLSLDCFHPGLGYYAGSNVGSLVTQANKHHMEATGWATGTLTVPGESYELGGLAWRDHSWGMRNWDNIRNHRAFYALFGEEFSFFPITFVGADNEKVKAGVVISGDTVQMTTDYDILSYIGSDAVTNAGGQVKLRLDGELLVMNFEPVTTCAISRHHNFVLADTMCRVTMGEKVGVGVAESSTNPQGGTFPPCASVPSNDTNGLFPHIADPWDWNRA